jgi:hypothetical protein
VTTLHPLDVLVIAVYFIVMLVIGVRIARRGHHTAWPPAVRHENLETTRRTGHGRLLPRTADFCTVAAGSGTDPIPEIRHAI